jgi:HEAT repeat protein
MMAVGRAFMLFVAIAALFSGQAELRPGLVYLVIAANILATGLGSFAGAGWWAWMADLIPESVRGHFFGRRHQIMLLASALSSVLASVAIERLETAHSLVFFAIFLFAALLGVIDPILFWWVPEPSRPPSPRRSLGQTLALYLRPLGERRFAWLACTAALRTFLGMMPWPFFILYQRGEEIGGQYIGCGISLEFLAFVKVFWLVIIALVARHWGHLADRIGHRTVYILSNFSMFSFVTYFFMGPDNYIWLLPLQVLLHGLIVAGGPVASQNLMIGIAPRAEREYYVSIFSAMVAGAGALGPWVGGRLADWIPIVNITLPHGQPVSYVHVMLMICFVGTVLNMWFLMRRIPDVRAQAVGPWFARMMSGELFRTAWNISAIGGAATPSRRIRALRAVRPIEGNVVLNDVAGALQDPDPGVRREALLALGRIGTDEAIELLMWHLHEPDRQTRTISAEALGASRSHDGTAPLVGALSDDDSSVRRAAADALGRLADRATLLKLLGTQQDAEVLVTVASALSRLREFRALRQMLLLGLQHPNRMVRAEIIVAMANMVGPPGRFYRVWRKEQRFAGSSVSKLARKLRSQARIVRRLRQREGFGDRRRQHQVVSEIAEHLELFVDFAQQEEWSESLSELRQAAIPFLELRYDYSGDPEKALEYLAAVDPVLAERYWLLDYLQKASTPETAPEAPWDGLTLLAAWAILHGQPPT